MDIHLTENAREQALYLSQQAGEKDILLLDGTGGAIQARIASEGSGDTIMQGIEWVGAGSVSVIDFKTSILSYGFVAV